MEWTDRGLVLAKGVFRENDVWLRVLFREHGVLMVSAFGGLKSKRRFVGCLDVMNVLECRVKERKGFHDLVEAVLLGGPGALRKKPKAQGLAMNFLKLVDSAGFTKDLSPEMLRLLEESLELLKADGDVPDAPNVTANTAALSLFFRLKFMGLLGYASDFLSCGLCSKPLFARSFFSVEEGALLCSACFGQSHAGYQGAWLDPSTLCLLQEARDTWPSQWAGVQDISQGAFALIAGWSDTGPRAASRMTDVVNATDAMYAGPETRLLRLDGVDYSGGKLDPNDPASADPDSLPDGFGGAGEFDADEMAETARVLARERARKRTFVGLFAFLSEKERKQASLCIDGMLSYHVGLAWDKGRYVRT